jgi:hypothetical protein
MQTREDDDTAPNSATMTTLIRSGLLLLLFVLVLIVGISHGLRGLAVAGVVFLIWALRDTRAFRSGEAFLIRLTGSRSRAWITALSVVIVALVAVDVYQTLH